MTNEPTRTIYLIVQNDGTDEIHNLHSIPVVLSPTKTAYAVVWAAFIEAYMDEEYPACRICDEGNAYMAMPHGSKPLRTADGSYVVDRNYTNDCCGTLRWKLHEKLEDPVDRTFLPCLYDPDAQPVGEQRIFDGIAANPEACKAFVPLSSVLRILDVWRGLVTLQE